MSTSITSLIAAVSMSEDNLASIEATRDAYLEPILVALGATGGGISHCSIDGDKLHITRSGSCRGCRWDDNYTFPLALFGSKDPLKAATEYVAVKKKAKEDTERREKLATIKRLQKELT